MIVVFKNIRLVWLSAIAMILLGAGVPASSSVAETPAQTTILSGRTPRAQSAKKTTTQKPDKPSDKKRGKAIASVVLSSVALPVLAFGSIFAALTIGLGGSLGGIFFLLPGFLLALLGLILGALALQNRAENPQKYGGFGGALAGVIIGAIFVVLILASLASLLLAF